ncbi:MoaD/ThiS family protein [uncultured Psychroserpens sp.]|uniref:MoaD/ThiS family protein n=1 Tax=uncultured Psychroserpens sp. TaxID=255436 RepID=UPI00260E89AE|nr:MoaD/ThiS family protein [uncultured Psychroserpens sp.]
MTLKIKYFGMLAEITQCEEETLSFSKGTAADLLKVLFEKHPILEEKEFQIAQNQTFISNDSIISNAEIVLLPPFAGG